MWRNWLYGYAEPLSDLGGRIRGSLSQLDLGQGCRPFDRQHQCPPGTPSTFRNFDDFSTLSKNVITKYEDLLSQKRYGPALNTPPVSDQPVIKGMKADINNSQLEQVDIDNRSRSGTSHGGSNGSNGSGGSNNNRGGNTRFFKHGTSDYESAICLPPGPGEPVKKVNRRGLFRLRSWCSICQRWWYHVDDEHDAWKLRRDEKAKEEKKETPPASETTTTTTGTPSSSNPAGKLASVTQINNESDSSDDDLISSSVFGELSPSWR